MQIILHIGTHKTGTTAIQKALQNSQESLHAAKIIVPHKVPQCFQKLQHIRKATDPITQHCRNYVSKIAGKYKDHRLLLSYEGFSGDLMRGYCNSATVAVALKEICHGHDPRIICFFRRQADFVESAYSQHLKQGGYRTFWKFRKMLESSLDWSKFAGQYTKLFGARYCAFSEYSSDVVSEFGKLISVNLSPAAAPVNIRYSATAVKIAQICNQHLDAKTAKTLRKQLQIVSKIDQRPAVFWDNEEKAAWQSIWDNSNEKLEKLGVKL